MKLVGANPEPNAAGLDELPGKANYLIGNDPKKWRTQVPTYAKVRFHDVYPGIDLVYHGNQGRLEYDLVVSPGADPRAIRFALETGNSKLETGKSKLENGHSGPSPESPSPVGGETPPLQIDSNGDLVIATRRLTGGEVRFHKPVVYQPQESRQSSVVSGQLRRPTDNGLPTTGASAHSEFTLQNSEFVDGRYVLAADHRIHFEIARYDKSRPLVIDPVLSYSTFLGGSSNDAAFGIAVDSSRSAYITGFTTSTDFPLAAPLDNTCGTDGVCNADSSFPQEDAFVTKLDPSGTSLIYSTYLGGSGSDLGNAIAVDSFGNAYIAGTTFSPDFPIANAFQSALGGGSDAFLSELDSSGSVLLYSTYLGGSGPDNGFGLALDTSNNAYLVGFASFLNFPTTPGAFQTTPSGTSSDAFVAKLNPALSGAASLVYSTRLGGAADDGARGVGVDSSGSALVIGFTFSTNFPTTAGAFQTVLGGSDDAFLTKVSPDGSKLVFSTYLGGLADDVALGAAVDSFGNVYLTGLTGSADFPTKNPLQAAFVGGITDAFVAKFDPTGQLVYSTYLGGSDEDTGSGVTVDAAGNAFVAGETLSTNFPLTKPFQLAQGGGDCGGYYYSSRRCGDAFVTELDAGGSSLIYSSYMGGVDDDAANAIALDTAGNAYIAGQTLGGVGNFPVTPGAFQTASLLEDAFVAKISPDAPGITFFPVALNFGDQSTATPSGSRAVTISNAGSASLAISSITLAGADAGDFALSTGTCGASISGGSNCSVSVSFRPSTLGPKSASLTVADNAAGSPQSVPLTGTGVPPAPSVSLSTPDLNFGSELVGTTSPALPVILTNTGDATLNISGITVSGDFGIPLTSCGTSLAPAGNCTISVSFKPTAPGVRNGALSIADDAAGSPHTVTLTGTGSQDFSLASDPTSKTVTAGQSATFTLSVTPAGGFNQAVSLACAGAPQLSTCTVSPLSVTPDGKNPATATVTVTTTARGAAPPAANRRPLPPLAWPLGGWLALGGLLLIVAASCARRTAMAVAAASRRRVQAVAVRQVTDPRRWVQAVAAASPPSLFSSCGDEDIASNKNLQPRSGAAARRRRYSRAWLLARLAAVLMMVGLWASCGGGGGSASLASQTGTPGGSFTLTITGTSGSLSHSAPVTLTVN